jgi:hypothetical protein
MTTNNFCFYLTNPNQTGGQWYSDTSPFSIPWFKFRGKLFKSHRPQSGTGEVLKITVGVLQVVLVVVEVFRRHGFDVRSISPPFSFCRRRRYQTFFFCVIYASA